MISSVARSSALAPYLSATTRIAPNLLRPAIPAVVQKATPLIESRQEAQTSYSLSSTIPEGLARVSYSLGGRSQVRFAHTDVQVPDFSAYRRDGVQSSSKSENESNPSRRAFTYMITAGATVPVVYAAKSMATQLVASMSASADVLAVAKIEIKLSDIPEGRSAVFKWRNKPLFIRHRTAQEIETEEAVDITTLRDPQHDSERVEKPEWLILLGVCTHLGCVPVAGVGDYGGYYCPCHGSHYDASGRIRKGPAPLNLEVPEYHFKDEDLLIVG